MGIQFCDWVENIVGKGEIARHEQFLLFPLCFQKLSVVDVSKVIGLSFAYLFHDLVDEVYVSNGCWKSRKYC